jgi:hypothetical protein
MKADFSFGLRVMNASIGKVHSSRLRGENRTRSNAFRKPSKTAIPIILPTEAVAVNPLNCYPTASMLGTAHAWRGQLASADRGGVFA